MLLKAGHGSFALAIRFVRRKSSNFRRSQAKVETAQKPMVKDCAWRPVSGRELGACRELGDKRSAPDFTVKTPYTGEAFSLSVGEEARCALAGAELVECSLYVDIVLGLSTFHALTGSANNLCMKPICLV